MSCISVEHSPPDGGVALVAVNIQKLSNEKIFIKNCDLMFKVLYFGYIPFAVVGNINEITRKLLAQKYFCTERKGFREMNMILKRQMELKKKNGKKGFTLIEVIVVIVILAILAAIAVPSLTGYIDKAKKRSVLAEAHTIQVALQAIGVDASELSITLGAGAGTSPAFTSGNDTSTTFVAKIAELTGTTYTSPKVITAIVFTGTKLTSFHYTDGAWQLDYANGEFGPATAV